MTRLAADTGPAVLEVTLNYAPRERARPGFAAEEPVERVPGTALLDRRSVRMHDARGSALRGEGTPSLDVQGFALVGIETKVADCYDPAEVRDVYYPEVERLVRSATGAARVLAFDHNVRCAALAERGERGARKPVKFAHNDYTERSGPQRVRDLLGGEAEELLRRRFAVINVWRPIRGPVEETPLGVCDARSIAAADLIASDLKYEHRTGEVYSLAFSPEHRWFYFPRMRSDEAMLLKCYDSARDGRARFTCHCAFRDPTSPPDAAPRESIEVRTLAFFA